MSALVGKQSGWKLEARAALKHQIAAEFKGRTLWQHPFSGLVIGAFVSFPRAAVSATSQENTSGPLSERIQKAVFRGRDSNTIRVKLALLAKEHPDLLDVAITSWENDEHSDAEKKLGGGWKSRIPLERFRDYKYQLLLDGSVAAYRTPYLFMCKGSSRVSMFGQRISGRKNKALTSGFGPPPGVSPTQW